MWKSNSPAASSPLAGRTPATSTRRDSHGRSTTTLLEIIEAAERDATITGREPAPGYTERAATIHHRQKNYAAEVAIIERWEAACPPELRGPGATQGRLAERLATARARLDPPETGPGRLTPSVG
jgi:acyl-CoA synthetase (NDP forming)